jgi:hypothetical protein
MRTLGIEIRKVGHINAPALFKDIDRVLAGSGIQSHGGSPGVAMQVTTIAHSLQSMLTKDWFSVSTVTECAKIAQITISSERMQIYNSMHCIHYNTMLPDYMLALKAMVLDDFRSILNPEPH